MNTDQDNLYSPKYDMAEEGFIRRNRNWKDFPETWLERRRQDVRELHKSIMAVREKNSLSLTKVV